MAAESKSETPLTRPSKLYHNVLLGNSGLRVSPLCLGTMTWGGKWGIGSTKEEAKEIFDEYVNNGGNFIDTANFYHAGHSELWLGEFMAEAGNRHDLVIATKFSLSMKTSPEFTADVGTKEDGTAREYYAANSVGNNRKSMRRALNESLKRLQTDYVDLYYVHYWDYITNPEEIMRTLNDLISAGKILHAAVSDAPVWAVAECNAMAKERGWARFDALQYKHSLLDRTIERDVLHYAQHRNHTVVAWDVLGGGKLTGKYKRKAEGDESKEVEGSKRASAWGIEMTEEMHEVVDLVREIATELDATCARVAMAWSLRQPHVLPLVGARTLAQLKDNLAALELPITDDQLARLSAKTALKDKGFVLSFIGSKFEENRWQATVKVLPHAK